MMVKMKTHEYAPASLIFVQLVRILLAFFRYLHENYADNMLRLFSLFAITHGT
jgi:hypothetical protein